MNVDELKAGRETDALVAEKVMGWTDIEKWSQDDMKFGNPPGENLNADVPYYSTDIAAAWEVIEKLADRFPYIERIEEVGKGEWEVTMLDKITHTIEANADTAPLAICRAALKAVGV